MNKLIALLLMILALTPAATMGALVGNEEVLIKDIVARLNQSIESVSAAAREIIKRNNPDFDDYVDWQNTGLARAFTADMAYDEMFGMLKGRLDEKARQLGKRVVFKKSPPKYDCTDTWSLEFGTDKLILCTKDLNKNSYFFGRNRTNVKLRNLFWLEQTSEIKRVITLMLEEHFDGNQNLKYVFSISEGINDAQISAYTEDVNIAFK